LLPKPQVSATSVYLLTYVSRSRLLNIAVPESSPGVKRAHSEKKAEIIATDENGSDFKFKWQEDVAKANEEDLASKRPMNRAERRAAAMKEAGRAEAPKKTEAPKKPPAGPSRWALFLFF
jgi:hypothetical protein